MQPPRPEQRQRAKPAARRESILGLARGAGASGISTAQICAALNLGNRLVSVLVSQYKAAGYLHAAGGPMQRRYFTEPALAAQAQQDLQATALERAAAMAERALTMQRARSKRSYDAQKREKALLTQIAELQAQLEAKCGDAAPAEAPATVVPAAPAATPGAPANATPKPRKARCTGRPGAELVAPPPCAEDAPVRINEAQRRPRGEIVIPPNVKRTVGPTPAGRYEVTGPVIGGFATMRPGHYLPDAGYSSYLDHTTGAQA